MILLDRIEQRIALPGDSETERSRKRLATILLLVSAVFTALNAVRLYNLGLTESGWIYLLLALLILPVFFVIVAIPRTYTPAIVFALFVNLIANLPGNYFAGGYTSGFELFVWVLLTPLLAVLLAGRRVVLIMFATFALTVLAAAYLEPLARNLIPDVDPTLVTREATANFMLLGFYLTIAGLYLFSQIEHYRQRADSLLLNILPATIAERLKEKPETIADGYSDVTVLFADIVDFTTMSSAANPVEVVNKLNEIFSDFDSLAAKHGLEKIKTIGDAYMVAAGLPVPRTDHCQAVTAFALEIVEIMERHLSWTGEPMGIRVGINCGPVVAGVIGNQKFIYDLWGDTVNVASRMESNGLPNQIQVTEAVKEKLDGRYQFEERDPIYVKGKGMMVTYLLDGLDETGR